MDREPGRFWGWPGARNLAYAYIVLGIPVFAWFVLIYAGADYVTGLHSYRVPLYLDWEVKNIPFVPATVLLYNSLHLAYAIAPFILRTRPEMKAMVWTWTIMTLMGGVLFLIIPFEAGFPAPDEKALGSWRMLYQLADNANLTYNACPSLHVAWSIACLDVFATRAGLIGKALLALWGMGVVLSTLLLHQHHLVDVAGGLALALFGSRYLFPRFERAWERRPTVGSPQP